ncbi:MAG: hypothetical protein R6V85_12470 [Polyangia bacterium]
MGRRKRKRKKRSYRGGGAPTIGELGTFAEEAARIEDLFRRGAFREALSRAKALHRRDRTDEAENLVARAYSARADAMIASGMRVEAKALLDVVESDFTRHREIVLCGRARLAALNGEVDDLLAPLARHYLPAEKRRGIEDDIRRFVVDPRHVAECEILSREHPLRLAAAELSAALEAATSGPVVEEDLACPSVSRRSPLAPWKLLARAIAAFYRRDDATCEELIGALPPESAPAAIAPAFGPLLGGARPRIATPPVAALVAAVLGERARLRDTLAAVDETIAAGKRLQAGRVAKAAMKECLRTSPELAGRLAQRIAARCLLIYIPFEQVRRALGGKITIDSDFWRLFVRTNEILAERHGEAMSLCDACAGLEELRRHCLAEGRFTKDGPEEAALYLRMIDLLDLPPDTIVEEARALFERDGDGLANVYKGQPPQIRARASLGQRRDFYFLYPERIWERACHGDPDPDILKRRFEWTAARNGDWRALDEIALAWREAAPGDVRPLLHLARSAENRGSLKKALGHVERAETIEPNRADVQRARRRLLAATARRHLAQRKPHLVERDLDCLARLPGAEEAGRRAMIAALRFSMHVLTGDIERARSHLVALQELLGDDLAAAALCEATAELDGALSGASGELLPDAPALVPPGSIALAAARVCAIGEDHEAPLGPPRQWRKRIVDDLAAGSGALGATELAALARAATRARQHDLAYAASGAGLALGSPHAARFLLLRADALPPARWLRILMCLRAALGLARRAGDSELVGEILTAHRESGRRARFPATLLRGGGVLEELDHSRTEEVILRERDAASRPSSAGDDPTDSWWTEELAPCDCPACRRARGEEPLPRGEEIDDAVDQGDEEGPVLDSLDSLREILMSQLDMPPEMLHEFIEEMIEREGNPMPDLPPRLAACMLEISIRFGQSMMDRPDPEELKKRAPDLYRRLDEAIRQAEASGDFSVDWPESTGRENKKDRKRNKRNRKKRKRKNRRR